MTFFYPVQGYIITPTKLINVLSTYVSFYYYPEVAFALTVLFTAAVAAAVAFSPTELKWRWLCALLMLAIPTNPEAFGLPLMAFWWGGVLVFLALLWNLEGRARGWQVFHVVLGGFSAPIIVAMLPLFWMRAWLTRVRADLMVAGFATAIGAVQTMLVFAQLPPSSNHAMKMEHIPAFIEKYFAGFFVDSMVADPYPLWLGIVIVLALGIFAARRLFRQPADYVPAALLLMFLATALLSSIRMSPTFTHPVLAGPRYYFYPYILMFWTLVYAAFTARDATGTGVWRMGVRAVAAGANVVGVANAAPAFSVSHDPPDWRARLDHCLGAGDEDVVRFDVHFNGLSITSQVGRFS